MFFLLDTWKISGARSFGVVPSSKDEVQNLAPPYLDRCGRHKEASISIITQYLHAHPRFVFSFPFLPKPQEPKGFCKFCKVEDVESVKLCRSAHFVPIDFVLPSYYRFCTRPEESPPKAVQSTEDTFWDF